MVRTASTVVDRGSAVAVGKKAAPTFDIARYHPQPYLQRTDSTNNIANSVRSVEKSFEDAARTGKLSLSSKKLRDFPGLFVGRYDLRDMTAVDLAKNQLNEVPVDVCQFSFLETFTASENIIKHVPESFAMLHFLLECDLSRNQLASFPHCLWRLQSLQILDLSYNNISSLPSTIGRMRDLEQLNVASNALSYLPNEIGNLHKLKSIQFNMNSVTELPDSFCDLVQLIEIDASDNHLAYLPLELRRLIFLEELRLEGNPLVIPPDEVVERGLVYIMRVLEMHAMQRMEREVSTKRATGSVKQQQEKPVLASVQQTPSPATTSTSSSNGFGTGAQPTSSHSRRARPKFDLALSKQSGTANACTSPVSEAAQTTAKPVSGGERSDMKGNANHANNGNTEQPANIKTATSSEPVYYGQHPSSETVFPLSRGVDEVDQRLSQSGMTPSSSRTLAVNHAAEAPATSGNAPTTNEIVNSRADANARVPDPGLMVSVQNGSFPNETRAEESVKKEFVFPPSKDGSAQYPPTFDTAVSVPSTNAVADAVVLPKQSVAPAAAVNNAIAEKKPLTVDVPKRKPAPEVPSKKHAAPILPSSVCEPAKKPAAPPLPDSTAVKSTIRRRTSLMSVPAAVTTRLPAPKPLPAEQPRQRAASSTRNSTQSGVADTAAEVNVHHAASDVTTNENSIAEANGATVGSAASSNNTREFLKWHEQIRAQQREHAKRFAVADSKSDAIYLYKSLDGDGGNGNTGTAQKNTDRRFSADAAQAASSKPFAVVAANSKDEFNPNFTIRRQFEHVKEEVQKLLWLQKVFETRLHCTVSPETDFINMLSDGVCLCRLANACRPGVIPTQLINCNVASPCDTGVTPSNNIDAVPNPSINCHSVDVKKDGLDSRSFLSPVKAMKNIELFLDACRQVGIPQDKLCSAADVLECKHIVRIATTVESFLALVNPSLLPAPATFPTSTLSGSGRSTASGEQLRAVVKADSTVVPVVKSRQISPASSTSVLSIRRKPLKTSAGAKTSSKLPATANNPILPRQRGASTAPVAARSTAVAENVLGSTLSSSSNLPQNKIRSPANTTMRKLMPPTKIPPPLSSSSCSSPSPNISAVTATRKKQAVLLGSSKSIDNGVKAGSVMPNVSRSAGSAAQVRWTAAQRRRLSSGSRRTAGRSGVQQSLSVNETAITGGETPANCTSIKADGGLSQQSNDLRGGVAKPSVVVPESTR